MQGENGHIALALALGQPQPLGRQGATDRQPVIPSSGRAIAGQWEGWRRRPLHVEPHDVSQSQLVRLHHSLRGEVEAEPAQYIGQQFRIGNGRLLQTSPVLQQLPGLCPVVGIVQPAEVYRASRAATLERCLDRRSVARRRLVPVPHDRGAETPELRHHCRGCLARQQGLRRLQGVVRSQQFASFDQPQYGPRLFGLVELVGIHRHLTAALCHDLIELRADRAQLSNGQIVIVVAALSGDLQGSLVLLSLQTFQETQRDRRLDEAQVRPPLAVEPRLPLLDAAVAAPPQLGHVAAVGLLLPPIEPASAAAMVAGLAEPRQHLLRACRYRSLQPDELRQLPPRSGRVSWLHRLGVGVPFEVRDATKALGLGCIACGACGASPRHANGPRRSLRCGGGLQWPHGGRSTVRSRPAPPPGVRRAAAQARCVSRRALRVPTVIGTWPMSGTLRPRPQKPVPRPGAQSAGGARRPAAASCVVRSAAAPRPIRPPNRSTARRSGSRCKPVSITGASLASFLSAASNSEPR